MTPPEREAGFVVPTPAEASAAVGEGGGQQGGCCSASNSTSNSTRSAPSTSLSNSLSNSSGWDVEADAALLELLREDMKVLSEVSFWFACASNVAHTPRGVRRVPANYTMVSTYRQVPQACFSFPSRKGRSHKKGNFSVGPFFFSNFFSPPIFARYINHASPALHYLTTTLTAFFCSVFCPGLEWKFQLQISHNMIQTDREYTERMIMRENASVCIL